MVIEIFFTNYELSALHRKFAENTHMLTPKQNPLLAATFLPRSSPLPSLFRGRFAQTQTQTPSDTAVRFRRVAENYEMEGLADPFALGFAGGLPTSRS